ncbi:MAG: preprotein translocase subunit SecA [Mycoplasmoidaceae bacterium]
MIINRRKKNHFEIKRKSQLFKEAKRVASNVNLKKDEYRALTNAQIQERIDFFSKKLQSKQLLLEEIIIDALAIGREIAFRTHKLFAFDVQIMGSYIICNGDFAEMKTGEGKTLTILISAFVMALEKKGVHIVTVNEYLVERDAKFSQAALEKFGITVGYNLSSMQPNVKKEMFSRDITYTTNSELGFDYLRDNMVTNINDKSIRDLHFAIIDEGDSILIDEAKTPLIISGNPINDVSLYLEVDKFVKSLNDLDYLIDAESNTISLSDFGSEKSEKYFKIKNIYSIESSELIHKIHNSLTANFVFKNGQEYIVQDNEINLIDSFTGRILKGHSYNAGLQQAIQAKENVEIEPENRTLATITYQSFFRMYKKLSALSGTAYTEKEEFLKIYNLDVIQIPTNKPNIRLDYPDYIFGKKSDKWKHVISDIAERNKKGQPVLVGTSSVNDSEYVSKLLTKLGLTHEVLSAKNNARESEIIANAGKKASITISTNMAGRGTDIKINEEVKRLGGLYVIGTERNESRRIDDQLRGRSGRQGDPGESRFYTSLQDMIFKRFASERFEKAAFKLQSDDFFDSKYFSKFLSKTQKKIEGINFDMRKNIIDYDHVLSSQRELIYKQRDHILRTNNLEKIIIKMIYDCIDNFIIDCRDLNNSAIIDAVKFSLFLNYEITFTDFFKPKMFISCPIENAKAYLTIVYDIVINLKFQLIKQQNYLPRINQLLLTAIDNFWMIHLEKMSRLRDSSNLRAYEQKTPLNIYTEEGNILFEKMKLNIIKKVLKEFNDIHLQNYSLFILPILEKKLLKK